MEKEAAMTDDNKILIEVKKISDDDGSGSSKTVVISGGDDELPQMELLNEDKVSSTNKLPAEQPVVDSKETACSILGNVEVEKKNEKGMEEIVKELKKVQKQNSITHCLLSVMILLTVAWQLSEVSLILTVKNKFTNPFKSVGNLIKGAIAGGGIGGVRERIVEGKSSCENDSKSIVSDFCSQIEPPPLPELRIPDLGNMDFPGLGSNGGNEV
ncbi:hypothetical protein C5167_006661 [Papaver somniferum]|uniref:Uncharacterized protein n=1 Tax=Papaver somniferum TaxID=3469 RepID=A0A4Y7JE36_PAPSO|nr:uncharacterized protein LOC113273162 [Papaver somniferum]RZC59363.1 hypothetical protein C5167_006661 [Papaver somniferum]